MGFVPFPFGAAEPAHSRRAFRGPRRRTAVMSADLSVSLDGTLRGRTCSGWAVRSAVSWCRMGRGMTGMRRAGVTGPDR